MNESIESSKMSFVEWKRGLSSKTYWSAHEGDFFLQSMRTVLPVDTLRDLLEKYDE